MQGRLATGIGYIEKQREFLWRLGDAYAKGGRLDLAEAQLKALPSEVRDREERERVARQRILLRVATDLWLVGVLRSLEDVTRPEEASKALDSGKVLDTIPKPKASSGKAGGNDGT